MRLCGLVWAKRNGDGDASTEGKRVVFCVANGVCGEAVGRWVTCG